jgi:uncharacterized delta-60 repeat protein
VLAAAAGAKHLSGVTVTATATAKDRAPVVVTFNLQIRGPAGSLDTSFCTDGITTVKFGGSNAVPNAGALQPDGKIVAAGFANGNPASLFAVVRLTSEGMPDTTFALNGQTADLPSVNGGQGTAVLLQPDGKIVVGGSASDASGANIGLLRYTSAGVLDTASLSIRRDRP